MGEMGYEKIRKYARKELRNPNRYSVNRLAALRNRADIECGQGSGEELHQELFPSDQNHSRPSVGYSTLYATCWDRIFPKQ